jgi:hypothetical protein
LKAKTQQLEVVLWRLFASISLLIKTEMLNRAMQSKGNLTDLWEKREAVPSTVARVFMFGLSSFHF